jgi:hypothetical protein
MNDFEIRSARKEANHILSCGPSVTSNTLNLFAVGVSYCAMSGEPYQDICPLSHQEFANLVTYVSSGKFKITKTGIHFCHPSDDEVFSSNAWGMAVEDDEGHATRITIRGITKLCTSDTKPEVWLKPLVRLVKDEYERNHWAWFA